MDSGGSQSIRYGPWRDQVEDRTDSSYFSGANVNLHHFVLRTIATISSGPMEESAYTTPYFVV